MPSASGGSSPRVRGTAERPTQPGLHGRFIPACAGNSIFSFHPTFHQPVHPRVCGEQYCCVCFCERYGGSSPRVRGTGHDGTPTEWVIRFIPACAGNSRDDPARRAGVAVHPRVCGEQGSHRQISEPVNGSSPRVRGTVDTDSSIAFGYRFIPACAGNSWSSGSSFS